MWRIYSSVVEHVAANQEIPEIPQGISYPPHKYWKQLRVETPKLLGIIQQKQGRDIEELKKHHWTFKKAPPSLRWIHSLFFISFYFRFLMLCLSMFCVSTSWSLVCNHALKLWIKSINPSPLLNEKCFNSKEQEVHEFSNSSLNLI